MSARPGGTSRTSAPAKPTSSSAARPATSSVSSSSSSSATRGSGAGAPAAAAAASAAAAAQPTAASRASFAIVTSTKEFEKMYEMGRTLGTGSFSEVKEGLRVADRKLVAIKVMEKSQMDAETRDAIAAEIRIHKQVKHPNIVQLYDIYETSRKIFLVQEHASGGELFDRIVDAGHFSESAAADIVRSVTLGVQHLHSLGVVHRDLKPENLLLSSKEPDARVMIGDFGLSSIVGEKKFLSTICGTPGYVAPEVLVGAPGGYGKEVDLWSIGVIMYILLCGFPPFHDDNVAQLFRIIKAAQFDFPSPWWDEISAEGLIRGLLRAVPRERLTCEQAGKASTKPLPESHRTKLQEMSQARRRWRRAAVALLAASRWKLQGGGGGAGGSGPASPMAMSPQPGSPALGPQGKP